MNEQETGVAVVPENSTALAPANDATMFGLGGDLALWTSIDKGSDEGKALIMKAATGTATKGPEVLMTETFNMANILVHKVPVASNDTGEIQVMDRVVLIDPKGETAAFVSNGVMQSLRLIFALYGAPPFAKPIPIRLVPVKTRRGFRTYNLNVVIGK